MTQAILSRRKVLGNTQINPSTNTGLWLDKYYLDSSLRKPKKKYEGRESKQVLVDELESLRVDEIYIAFFTRWEETLRGNGIEPKYARVVNRLAVNLGAESVLETNIALHHTYGVPYIPGSALKGLAAHFTAEYLGVDWEKGSTAYQYLFGDTDHAGHVTFFDALYVPKTGVDKKPLWKDVITVHHPEYYTTGTKPPADWDTPNIIPFLTATGVFLIALAGDKEWVKGAYEILKLALEKAGVGAKTNSGYGRMIFIDKKEIVFVSSRGLISERELLLREFPKGNRKRGEIIRVEQKGNFGIIQPATGEPEIKAHFSQVQGKVKFKVGQVVEYSKGSYKGSPQAKKVEVLLDV